MIDMIILIGYPLSSCNIQKTEKVIVTSNGITAFEHSEAVRLAVFSDIFTGHWMREIITMATGCWWPGVTDTQAL